MICGVGDSGEINCLKTKGGRVGGTNLIIIVGEQKLLVGVKVGHGFSKLSFSQESNKSCVEKKFIDETTRDNKKGKTSKEGTCPKQEDHLTPTEEKKKWQEGRSRKEVRPEK